MTATPTALHRWIYLGALMLTGVLVWFVMPGSLGVESASVGVASVVGYLPDTFASLISGAFADAMPAGGAGYRAYFGLLAGIAVIGLIATAGIMRRERRAGN